MPCPVPATAELQGEDIVALTTRAKALVGTLSAIVVVGAAAAGYLVLSGQGDAIPFLGGTRDEPAICPLTNVEAEDEKAAARTPVAVKVENSSESRPQAGLNQADIVYEEPVEGGITRFIAIYHCDTASRIGPVRSARFVDPSILLQYGQPIFGYSGAAGPVINAVAQADGVQDVRQDTHGDAYELDPNRSAPHNVYSSTRDLLRAGSKRGVAPEAVFEYDEEPPARAASKRGREVHLDFSPDADVYWRFDRPSGLYERLHGETPHTMEDGEQVTAANVVVQVVELRDSGIVDAAGNPSPEVVAVGSGDAYVLRDGRLIEGTWERGADGDVTRFLDASGEVIPLAPGRTWVELFPSDLVVEIG